MIPIEQQYDFIHRNMSDREYAWVAHYYMRHPEQVWQADEDYRYAIADVLEEDFKFTVPPE